MCVVIKRMGTVRRPTYVLLATAIVLVGGAARVAAEYRVQPGDSLEISAPPMPEFRHRAQINLDGEASFPLIGSIRVGGLTLSEVRTKVQALVSTQGFRRYTGEGREYPVLINGSEVNVVVAEYTPIYLKGDVAKPGEQAFRPGMTVRQTIALAGGYDIMRFRMTNPFLEQADLRSEYQTLWIELARGQIRLARLRTELGDSPERAEGTRPESPMPAALAAELQNTETALMQLRATDLAKEKRYLRESISQEDHRIVTLSQQQREETEGVQADVEELQRLQALLSKGSATVMRVVDARRSVLLSSTRQLQTVVQLAQVARQRGETGRRLDRVDDQRRLEILNEMQEVNTKIGTIRARIASVGEKLVYTGMIKSQLVRGKGNDPELIVFRKNGSGRDRLEVDEDGELQPGDVVEVALQAGLVPESTAESSR